MSSFNIRHCFTRGEIGNGNLYLGRVGQFPIVICMGPAAERGILFQMGKDFNLVADVKTTSIDPYLPLLFNQISQNTIVSLNEPVLKFCSEML